MTDNKTSSGAIGTALPNTNDEPAAQDTRNALHARNGALPRAKTLTPATAAEAFRKHSSNSMSARSSIYEALGGGVESGKTPFSLPTNDMSAATFLAQCYEQLMKDSANMHSDTSPQNMVTPPPLPSSGMLPAGTAPSALGRILLNHALDEPLTYVFIFTNPRSGNQQGRNLMDMALRNFRLRDRPEVQVQIYDVTSKESQREGLHYLHQLQLRQGDRLLKTAFPELFVDFSCGKQRVRPSPRMCEGSNLGIFGEQLNEAAAAAEADCSEQESSMNSRSRGGNADAWEEWITEAAAQLQSGLDRFTEEEITGRLELAQQSAIKLHVWSAGGDGTVSSTLEAMMDYGIDVGRLYFSCIPFGTGNDFADALGWGRSVPGDAVGVSMRQLNKIISERLDGYTCKLDIYEITFTTYDDGHIKHVEKNMFDKPGMRRHKCLMIDYFSLGVQGFVGSSFELHRPGKRALNILMYTVAAAKWVFLKKFPPINEALESVSTIPDHIMSDPKMTDADRVKWLENASEAERRQVLLARVAGPRKRSGGRKMTWTKEPKARRTATARDFGEGVDEDVPVIQNKPIEIDVQNVARFWGRNIDVWNNADEASKRRILSNTTGVTDRSTWTPQYAGDGKLELFGVRNIGDYALNQIPGRSSYRIDRLAQMGSPVALHFRHPQDYPPRAKNPLTDIKTIEQGLLYSMCDGEFIEMYHPRDVIISRKVTLKAVGRSPESSRIVLDTIKNDGLDAVQMDATAAASKTHTGEPASVSNYVSSPFMRIFRLGRNGRPQAPDSSSDIAHIGGHTTGSVLQIRSPARTESAASNNGNNSGLTRGLSQTSNSRRSLFASIRDSLFRSSGVPRSTSASLKNSSSDSSNSSIVTPEANGGKHIAAKTMPPKMKSSISHLSTVHEKSPLKVRQSLSDLRQDSTSPPTADSSRARLNSHGLLVDLDPKAPAKHPVHTARSKSLDIRQSNTTFTNVPQSPAYSSSTNSTASAEGGGRGGEAYDLDVTSTSGLSESSGESSTMPNTAGSRTSGVNKHDNRTRGTQELLTPPSLQHCLVTLGKDLVESIEVFTPPEALLEPTTAVEGSQDYYRNPPPPQVQL
ncbi:hypothetical protein EV175_002591 [Coemansia sp. RSA 1933]|nr:hypothetical protein EV175_002591 [Coemansia sp. RSA 1933]